MVCSCRQEWRRRTEEGDTWGAWEGGRGRACRGRCLREFSRAGQRGWELMPATGTCRTLSSPLTATRSSSTRLVISCSSCSRLGGPPVLTPTRAQAAPSPLPPTSSKPPSMSLAPPRSLSQPTSDLRTALTPASSTDGPTARVETSSSLARRCSLVSIRGGRRICGTSACEGWKRGKELIR